MSVAITIPGETVKFAIDLATKLIDLTDKKEVYASSLPKNMKTKIDSIVENIKISRYDVAITLLESLILECPSYNRAKLQLINLNKLTGSFDFGIAVGGMILGRPTDNNTRAQACHLMGDCMLGISQEVVPQHVNKYLLHASAYYSKAIEFDEAIIESRWNQIDVYRRLGRMADVHSALAGLIGCLRGREGEFTDEIRGILTDWGSIFGSELGFEVYREQLNSIVMININDSRSTVADKSIHHRKSIKAIFRIGVMIAGLLAGTLMIMDRSDANDLLVSQLFDLNVSIERGVDDGLTAGDLNPGRGAGLIGLKDDPSEPFGLAGVEIDAGKLTDFIRTSAIDMRPGKLT